MEPDTLQEIADYVADSLWLSAFADAIERAADDGDTDAAEIRPGAGEDWQDTVTETPQRFKDSAVRILSGLPAGILAAGLDAWTRSSGCDLERLGHVVAMEILGHGVGLFDDIRPGARAGLRASAVQALSDALPCLDCSIELSAEWNPETGKVE
jgi:hypothetical protein